MNRGQYEQRLTSYWLKAMPDVQAGLKPAAARSTWAAAPAAYRGDARQSLSQRQGRGARSRP